MRFRNVCMAALVAVLLVAVYLVPSLPASAHHSGDPAIYPLYAGKDCLIGEVTVWNDESCLYVTYSITKPGWVLKETHLAVGDELCDIPQTKKGNPIPGQFPFGNCYDVEDMITYDQFIICSGDWENGDKLYVAAHASVAHVSYGCVEALSDAGQVCWWSGAMKGNINGAGYVVPGWCPWYQAVDAWEPFGGVDPSYWDQNLVPAGCAAELANSDWIWKSYRVSNAESYTGDIVFFKDTLCLPRNAFNINAGLCITTDNAYYFYLNDDWSGTPMGMAGFTPGYGPTNFYYVSDKVNNLGGGTNSVPYETLNKVYPKDAAISSDQAEWSSIEFYDLSADMRPGTNCLQIVAVNEHAPPETSDQNPAGLIYKLQACYSYVDKCETAWASSGNVGQTQFPGKNWATYFCYEFQGWDLVEQFQLNSASTTGANSAPLTDGGLYKLEVSGTWTNRGFESVDAKFTTADGWVTPTDAPGPPVVAPYVGTYDPKLLDVQLNNQFVDWGPYSSSHIYARTLIGTGGSWNFRVFDGNVMTNTIDPSWYGDNQGDLTVTVYVWG